MEKSPHDSNLILCELLPGLLAVAWQLRRKFEAPFEVRAIGWSSFLSPSANARDGLDHDCLDETAPHLVTPW